MIYGEESNEDFEVKEPVDKEGLGFVLKDRANENMQGESGLIKNYPTSSTKGQAIGRINRNITNAISTYLAWFIDKIIWISDFKPRTGIKSSSLPHSSPAEGFHLFQALSFFSFRVSVNRRMNNNQRKTHSDW